MNCRFMIGRAAASREAHACCTEAAGEAGRRGRAPAPEQEAEGVRAGRVHAERPGQAAALQLLPLAVLNQVVRPGRLRRQEDTARMLCSAPIFCVYSCRAAACRAARKMRGPQIRTGPRLRLGLLLAGMGRPTWAGSAKTVGLWLSATAASPLPPPLLPPPRPAPSACPSSVRTATPGGQPSVPAGASGEPDQSLALTPHAGQGCCRRRAAACRRAGTCLGPGLTCRRPARPAGPAAAAGRGTCLLPCLCHRLAATAQLQADP